PTVLFHSTHTATPALHTLSLHDALPIWEVLRHAVQHPDPLPPLRQGLHEEGPLARDRTGHRRRPRLQPGLRPRRDPEHAGDRRRDRKSTRLNSSHSQISYAVFCLKKKNK